MLIELLSKTASVAILCFVVSSMLGVGASLTVSAIVEPLRNVRLVVLSLLANFIVMPLVAIGLEKGLWLDRSFGIGLLVLGCAAGAPFLPRLVRNAKGDVACAVGVMVMLMVLTVIFLPTVLPLLLPGVTVDSWQIARSLILTMLLPLAAGLALNAYYAGFAERLRPLLGLISNISLVVQIVAIITLNIDKILGIAGERAILAGILFIATGLGVGWVLGKVGTLASDTRRVMAFGTGQRNVAAAMVVASESFGDPKVVVMVVVVMVLSLIALIPLSRAVGNRDVAP
jgi:BASS family bile acid:Na+ symporter